ncbi:hypothetical protein F5888DRAFT_1891179 [Russula emetica]|nr:hypothetical protein F5888DRAFT_1891179 [Russula emetica]
MEQQAGKGRAESERDTQGGFKNNWMNISLSSRQYSYNEKGGETGQGDRAREGLWPITFAIVTAWMGSCTKGGAHPLGGTSVSQSYSNVVLGQEDKSMMSGKRNSAVSGREAHGGVQKLASGSFQTEPRGSALRGVVRCTNLDAVKIHQSAFKLTLAFDLFPTTFSFAVMSDIFPPSDSGFVLSPSPSP